jgi:hypothetical protein
MNNKTTTTKKHMIPVVIEPIPRKSRQIYVFNHHNKIRTIRNKNIRELPKKEQSNPSEGIRENFTRFGPDLEDLADKISVVVAGSESCTSKGSAEAKKKKCLNSFLPEV